MASGTQLLLHAVKPVLLAHTSSFPREDRTMVGEGITLQYVTDAPNPMSGTYTPWLSQETMFSHLSPFLNSKMGRPGPAGWQILGVIFLISASQ